MRNCRSWAFQRVGRWKGARRGHDGWDERERNERERDERERNERERDEWERDEWERDEWGESQRGLEQTWKKQRSFPFASSLQHVHTVQAESPAEVQSCILGNHVTLHDTLCMKYVQIIHYRLVIGLRYIYIYHIFRNYIAWYTIHQTVYYISYIIHDVSYIVYILDYILFVLNRTRISF